MLELHLQPEKQYLQMQKGCFTQMVKEKLVEFITTRQVSYSQIYRKSILL